MLPKLTPPQWGLVLGALLAFIVTVAAGLGVPIEAP